MKIYRVGDKSKAICHKSGQVESVTYKLKDVPVDDSNISVKNILVGVCDCCGDVVSIPKQSTPAIQKIIRQARKPVESRVPAHMLDILNMACEVVGADTGFQSSIVKYYVHRYAQRPSDLETLVSAQASELAQGKADKRLSLKGAYINEEIDSLKAACHFKSKGDVLKSVIVNIYNDVVEHKNPAMIKELKGIVASVI